MIEGQTRFWVQKGNEGLTASQSRRERKSKGKMYRRNQWEGQWGGGRRGG